MNANLTRVLIATGTATAGLVLAGVPSASGGQGQAPFVPAHRHFIETPTGAWEPIGPDACGNPTMQTAFNQFHERIHIGTVRDALNHEHNPGAIKAGGC